MRFSVTLRTATPADAQSIAAIHSDSWRGTYRNVLTGQYLADVVPGERNGVWIDRLHNPRPNQHVVVAESEGDIIGFVCVYAGENPEWGAYLDNLHVRRSHQSHGVGKALLIEAARWSHRRDPGKGMCLLVNQDNVGAQAFYTRLGARNAREGVWNAPDGSVVPTYWFVWDRLRVLAELSPGTASYPGANGKFEGELT